MKYIKEIDSFEPKDIFECGQCFRWNKQDDGSYTGVFYGKILNVKKESNKIIFDGNATEEEIERYFDLQRDYSKIKSELSLIDEYLKQSIEFGSGIRILNQDLFETIISFIISANNNIPRIKGIINKICTKYGQKVEYSFDGNKVEEYYTFPTPEELSRASIKDLRELGLGFRDVRVYETTKLIANKEFKLDDLYKMTTDEAKQKLLTFQGVGPKVCDCILLFSTLKKFDVFPIDVWVRRVMNELYIKNPDETKVDKKEIKKLADEKYGNLEGMAQQYLFYWKRETSA